MKYTLNKSVYLVVFSFISIFTLCALVQVVEAAEINIAEDFESYPSTSLLTGGAGGIGWNGSWNSSPLFKVTDQSLPNQGLKHLSIQPVSDPFEFAIRSIPETASGTVYVDMKIDHPGGRNNIGVRGDINLYENDKLLARVFMRLSSSGDYIESLHWDGDSTEWFIAATVENQTYYRVGIQFNKSEQGNKYRINVDGGPWTEWRSMVDNSEFTSINKLSLSVSNQDGQAIGTMYFDDIVIVRTEQQVTIKELINQLIETVKGKNFGKPIEQSYLAHLEKLGGMLDTANTNAIRNQLEAFIKKLADDVKKGAITEADALILTKKAEVILHRLSEAIDPVPLVTQIVSPYPSIAETSVWAPATYAGGRANKPKDCGLTIAQCGCAISSLSMLGKYYGINTGYDRTNVNPLNMNDWLLANNGYTAKGSILWNYALAYMGEKKNGKAMTRLSLDTQNATVTETIRTFVNKSTPALGFSNANGHWMVLTGTNDEGFTIRDPFWYNTTTTDDIHDAAGKIQGYSNIIDKANLIGYSAPLHNIDESVEIVLESPAELLITDSRGRRLGFDPVTHTYVSEIPGGSYDHEDFIADPSNPSPNPHKAKRLMLIKPEGEVFDLKVIGTGSGEYNLTAAIADGKGGLVNERASSTTSLGQVDAFTVTTSMDTNDLPPYLKTILGQIPVNYQKKFIQAFKVIVGQTEKDHVVSTTHIIEGLIKYTKQQFGSTSWANGVMLALTALIP